MFATVSFKGTLQGNKKILDSQRPMTSKMEVLEVWEMNDEITGNTFSTFICRKCCVPYFQLSSRSLQLNGHHISALVEILYFRLAESEVHAPI